MFNIGPLELVVLAFVGIVVLGPDRLPGLARDAGRLLRSLRDMATGARTQLREELGPEFADIDLRSLNPRTAITSALLGDDFAGGNPRAALQRAFLGDPATSNGTSPSNGSSAASTPAQPPASRPPIERLGRNEAAPYDPDAT